MGAVAQALGRWEPRPLYRLSYREILREMIIDAQAAGVAIPADMPCDTDQHVKMAIVVLGRRLAMHAGK